MPSNTTVCLRTACFWAFLRSDFGTRHTSYDVLQWITNDKNYKNVKPVEFDILPNLENVESILAKAAKDNHLYLTKGHRSVKLPNGNQYFLKLYSFHTRN